MKTNGDIRWEANGSFGSLSKQHMTSRKLHVNVCKEREKKGVLSGGKLNSFYFQDFLWQKKMMDMKAAVGMTQRRDDKQLMRNQLQGICLILYTDFITDFQCVT